MTQHVVLLLAPLAFVLGHTGTALLLGLAPRQRTAVSRWMRESGILGWLQRLTRRPVAWAVLVLTVGVWHVPPIFDAAATSEPLHALEHGSFLLAGAVYWASILGGSRRREQASALLSIFGIMLVGTAFGALLTFASTPWYPAHAELATLAGLDWLSDQQIAGLVMWLPPSVVMLAVFLRVAASWLNAVERRSRRVEVAS
jgi:cytochrome c oxidase assembly factor CtaG